MVSEPNDHTTKLFSGNLLDIEIKETPQIVMIKSVYLGLYILKISKMVMYEFLYDYVKLK